MSSKTNFNTPKVARLNPFIPQATIAGNLVFVSGTAGINPGTGKIESNSYEEQAWQAFRNLQTIVEEAGSSLDKIIKTTVFMVSGADPDFSVTNKIYNHFFPDNPPARSAPQVMPFPGGILISVECIALC